MKYQTFALPGHESKTDSTTGGGDTEAGVAASSFIAGRRFTNTSIDEYVHCLLSGK